jgi:hypothetical protein
MAIRDPAFVTPSTVATVPTVMSRCSHDDVRMLACQL